MMYQKGGKLIGKGTYGCVFKPPIPCKSGESIPSDVVSKVMYSKDALEELNETKEISAIDRTNKYHLPEPRFCKVPKHKLGGVPDIHKCNPINEVYDTAILQYKYGGIDIQQFLSQHKEKFSSKLVKKILYNLRPLLVGLCEMKRAQFTHSDIKLQNLIIDPKTYKINFIDYGLSQNFSKIRSHNDIKKSYIYESGYFCYPPEAIFLTEPYADKKIFKTDGQIRKEADDIYKESYAGTIRTYYLTDGNYVLPIEKYNEDYLRLTKKEFTKLILGGIDTFSLGIAFVIIFSHMHRHRFRYDTNHNYLLYYLYFMI